MNVFDANYTIQLKLSNYLGSRIMPIENEDGFIEDCLVIPLKINDLSVSKSKNVYGKAFMTRSMNGNIKGWSHYLRMKVGREAYDKMLSLGYSVPYLGNAKPSSWDLNLINTNERVKNKTY